MTIYFNYPETNAYILIYQLKIDNMKLIKIQKIMP